MGGFSAASVAKGPAPTQLHPTGYALEKPTPAKSSATSFIKSVFRMGPSVEERRAANTKELERLVGKDKELKARKRDLLRSDVQGHAAYEQELAEYNAALAKATAEKNELATIAK